MRQIPHKGIGFGPVIGYKGIKLPLISFNYLGQFEKEKVSKNQESAKEGWNIVGEDSGTSMSIENNNPNLISINVLVIDGFLHFNVTTKFGNKITSFLANTFKEYIEKIILHCCYQKESEYTVGDFVAFEPYILFNGHTNSNNENKLFLLPPGGGGAESYFNNVIPYLQDINIIAFKIID